MSNKEFWDLVKPLLLNKGVLISNDISLVKNETIVTDDDNTLAYFSKSLPDLVNTLEKETGVALSWLETMK